MKNYLFKTILKTMIGIFSVLISLITYFVIIAYNDLPNVENLIDNYTASVPTTIYDSKGKKIDLIFKEIREEISIEEMTPLIQSPFLAMEDRRFYSHYGLDPIRLTKALIVNILNRRKVQGGSTITQQLAKNAFLTQEKKIIRKIKEALITIEIEKKYTKDEIFQKYLNEIYFGSGAYGIKTAAKSFFNKNVNELNIAEIAMLAGIPNRPNKYNPRINLGNAIKKKNLIIQQMYKHNFISNTEKRIALNHQFILQKDLPESGSIDNNSSTIFPRKNKNILKVPDFTDVVQKKLFNMFGENTVYSSGLKVYTTLDSDMQKVAKETFETYPLFLKNKEFIKKEIEKNSNNPKFDKDKLNKLDGALITIDTNNGHIKSIIGGVDFKDGDFNRALYSKKQPGSSIKPFLYFTALKKNLPMNLVVEDSKFKLNEWSPKNYGNNYKNNLTILDAMERSVNIVAIKLLRKVGIPAFKETLNTLNDRVKIQKDLSIALGTMEVSPYELAKMYIPFSNGGYQLNPSFITKIEDRYGKTIYEPVLKKEKIFDNADVSMIVHMLKDAVKFGSGYRAKVKDNNGKYIEQGGKTGTTNGFQTAWFAGITPKYVTVVYVGNDKNISMKNYQSGGRVAAPIWQSYYQELVRQDLYNPSKIKFKFLDNNIKDNNLISLTLDSFSGLISDKTSTRKRKFLLKRWQHPVESNSKYIDGLDKFTDKVSDSLTSEDIKNIKQDLRLKKADSYFNDLFKNKKKQ